MQTRWRAATPTLLTVLGWTTGMATFLSIWVVAVSVVRRSFYFDQYHMSTWQVLGSYYAAGVIAALALRLLWPLTRWRAGAFAVGTVIGTMTYGVIMFALGGWSWSSAWLATIPGTLVGGGLGAHWFSKPPL